MAHVIALPLSTQPRRATVSHVWPAEITDMADLYHDAARVLRGWANAAAVRGEKERAAGLRAKSEYYDRFGDAIQQKADALARARARGMAAEIIELTNERAG